MPNSKNINELYEFISKQQFDKITDNDWETLLTALSEKRDWEQIWRLAQVAPAMWSVQLLLRLKEAVWSPKQTSEQKAFRQLAKLAEEFSKRDDNISWVVDCYTVLKGKKRGEILPQVESLTISPDGRRLASSTRGDRTVCLWNLPKGTLLHTLEGSEYCELMFSPDGQILVSEGMGIWEGRTGDYFEKYEIRCWHLRNNTSGYIVEANPPCTISPNWRILVSRSEYGNTIRLWSLPDGGALQRLKGHTGGVSCLAISSDGQVLASGGHDNTLRLWSLSDGRVLRTLEGHAKEITCVTISSNGKLLVSGSKDGTVRVWDLLKGVLLYILGVSSQEQWMKLAISSNDQVLVAQQMFYEYGPRIGEQHYWEETRLWQLPNGRPLNILEGNGLPFAISPDGQMLVNGGHDNTLRLWRLTNGTLLNTLEGSITPLVFSPNGRILACRSDDNTIRLWSLPDGISLQTLNGHTKSITCIAITPDGRILASGSKDGTVRLWALWKVRLKQLISEPTSPEHVKWVEDTLKEETVTGAERKWLEFLLALMRWQMRFDVEADESALRHSA